MPAWQAPSRLNHCLELGQCSDDCPTSQCMPRRHALCKSKLHYKPIISSCAPAIPHNVPTASYKPSASSTTATLAPAQDRSPTNASGRMRPHGSNQNLNLRQPPPHPQASCRAELPKECIRDSARTKAVHQHACWGRNEYSAVPLETITSQAWGHVLDCMGNGSRGGLMTVEITPCMSEAATTRWRSRPSCQML
jgi:hypothetical protein